MSRHFLFPVCLASVLVSCSTVGDVPPWWPGLVPMDADQWCTAPRDAGPPPNPGDVQGRDAVQIELTVRALHPQLQSCYGEFMDRVGVANGHFETQLLIEESGAVTDACVWETDLKDQALAACVLRTYRSLDFGRWRASTTVRSSIVFSANAFEADDARRYPYGKERTDRRPFRVVVPRSIPR